MEEMYEHESWTSSDSYRDLLICPSFRSYSSLDLLSCKSKDEEECRLVNLNNVIKKLFDTIDDPIKKEDVPVICCLLEKFLKYNGTSGFYAKHLPQIGEILEFLSMQAKKVEQYLHYLQQLLELCCKPLLVQCMSEHFSIKPKLLRYSSLLGYLLVLAPTKASFDTVKKAIQVFLSAGKDEAERTREDTVKPDVRHEAVEQSRLPLTLAELTEVASTETYPAVLQLILAVASVSRICCHRMLEAGVESRILMRLHPAYECGFESAPVTDQTNLLLDKEDYVKTAEYATKILCRMATSIMISDQLPKEHEIASPTKQAMWSLRAAFRREALRARGSWRSRKLRNELANLILTGVTRSTAQWELVGAGLIDDLAGFFVATEFGIIDAWAEVAEVEVNNTTGLEFKKTLLTIVARVVQLLPECHTALRNKHLVSSLLQLVDPTSGKSTRMLWNSEQLWHLFKYASDALTYVVPKLPDEFIEDDGALRYYAVIHTL
ncbi:uncharacterized protein LOC131670138 [Phymastichus coffea]|uniref:uncharacterized protein LOC131670138 n=1 Tax=Phymastichus coffea TaxID=108790 RepID=UPI00273A7599|nr:uncharacterized protein LOC131670138 [Phymastichus coffea]